MEKMRLTVFVLALKNLKTRPFRTKSLIVIVGVLAFTIFCGVLLSQSLSLGRNYMSGKMGADIMVVPRGYAINLQNTLLKSESNTFYLKENLSEGVSKVPGVEKISPQLYIGSLNASCCSVPVQLIGFDPKTDFTIKNWMTKIDTSKIGFGEVVTGSRVNGEVGSELWMYGTPLKVISTLEDTGMGFDSSIFMTMETAKYMIKNSGKYAVHPAGSGNEQTSALFIKLSDALDSSEIAKKILSMYPDTDVVTLNEIIGNISFELSNIKGLIYGIQTLLWGVSILLLIIINTFTAYERKREFGLLLALGATRMKLRSLLLTETLLVSLMGSLCGAAAAGFLMYEFRMLIAVSLGIPYIQPTIGSAFVMGGISLSVSILTGIIASIYSTKRIERMETQMMIRSYD